MDLDPHPLLCKEVLLTLVEYIAPNELDWFRLVCKEMYDKSLSKFRKTRTVIVDIDSTCFIESYFHQWENQDDTMKTFCKFEEYPYEKVVLDGYGKMFGYRPDKTFWKSPLALGIKHLHLSNIDMRTTLEYFLDIVYKYTPNLESFVLERNKWYTRDALDWASRERKNISVSKTLKKFTIIGVDLKPKNKPTVRMPVPWLILLIHFSNLEDLEIFGVTKNHDRTHKIFKFVVQAMEKAKFRGCTSSLKNIKFGHGCPFPNDSDPRRKLMSMYLLGQISVMKLPSVRVTIDFDCNIHRRTKRKYEIISFQSKKGSSNKEYLV